MAGKRSSRMRGAVGALSVALIVGVAAFALVSIAGSSGADASSTKAGGVPYARVLSRRALSRHRTGSKFQGGQPRNRTIRRLDCDFDPI